MEMKIPLGVSDSFSNSACRYLGSSSGFRVTELSHEYHEPRIN